MPVLPLQSHLEHASALEQTLRVAASKNPTAVAPIRGPQGAAACTWHVGNLKTIQDDLRNQHHKTSKIETEKDLIYCI